MTKNVFIKFSNVVHCNCCFFSSQSCFENLC